MQANASFSIIDGAMSYAAVWINGKLAGGWPYGYASWRIDLIMMTPPFRARLIT
jgi:beta-galactosidase